MFRRLPVALAAALITLALAAVALATGPYPALDATATARVDGANATSTAAYLAADAQTATASAPTPIPATPTTAPTATASAGMRAVPDPLYGVTDDAIDTSTSATYTALASMGHIPTLRAVFDRQNNAAYYKPYVTQLRPAAYIMGTLLDSSDMAAVSVAAVQTRATDYLTTLGGLVDIWEVGNEINGDWLCPASNCTASATADVVAKMTAMYDTMHNAGKRTALTLYYNGLDDTHNCYAHPYELMLRWARANVPARMLTGLDYVFISYYEQDCPSTVTDPAYGVSKDWNTVFTNIRGLFPSAKLGFGENGTNTVGSPTSLKQQYMDEYYKGTVSVAGYVHGHFWWYWRQDCVPMSNPLWSYLNTDMAAMR